MRVLLVEDDLMVGEALSQALRDAAFAVEVVANGRMGGWADGDCRAGGPLVRCGPARSLLFLMEAQSASLGEIAPATDSDTGSMTRLIERLKVKGLCTSERGVGDRRVVEIAMTEEGIRVVEGVRTVLDQVLEQHLAGFAPRERAALCRSLNRMVANGKPTGNGIPAAPND